jgi:uncharacterized oxidoreductase
MPTFGADYLENISKKLFQKAGVSSGEAEIVSNSLITANLMGLDSHGVIRVIQYLDLMAQGKIVPGAKLEIVKETPAMVIAKGGWGFGQVIARRATELAIEKARQTGLAAVSVGDCNHSGRIGEYTALVAEQGMLGLATANGHGSAIRVAPWGGRQNRLSTNPISFAVPTDRGHPLVVDMASSVIPEGKIRVARNAGKQLPEPWIIAADGHMSTDPNDLYGPPHGAILPLGGLVGHKGYALSVMIDILSGGLSTAGFSRGGDARYGNGFYVQAIDIAQFMPVQEFVENLERFAAYLQSSELAPGFSEILLPGDPEYNSKEKRLREGIQVDDETWRQLNDKAKQLGVEL